MRIATDAPKRPVLTYYGGKWRLASWLLGFFPAHHSYVEPCGGAASVLLRKPRSSLETYNDLDSNVVNFFRVLRDKTKELTRLIRLTPWSREEFELARNPDENPVESARRFFISSWMGRSNQAHNKTTGCRFSHKIRCPQYCVSYTKMISSDALQVVASRLMGVQIENRDAFYVIERYGHNNEALVYFDPPYVIEKRTVKRQYLQEVDGAFHSQAAALLHDCRGFVVVSGYACDLYRELYEEQGWERHDKETHSCGNDKRVESVWLSPRTTVALKRGRQSELLF